MKRHARSIESVCKSVIRSITDVGPGTQGELISTMDNVRLSELSVALQRLVLCGRLITKRVANVARIEGSEHLVIYVLPTQNWRRA